MRVRKCIICEKKEDEVNGMLIHLTSGKTICNECAEEIVIAIDIQEEIKDEEKLGSVDNFFDLSEGFSNLIPDFMKRMSEQPLRNWTPPEIKAELDETVIGQEDAKKVLAVAVSNHIKRIQDETAVIRKSNILLIGPSGSGKTLLMQRLAEILDIPIVIADATTLTQTGYVGEDVESVLTRLLMAAEGDILKAEKGMVFLDEIDKIGRKSSDLTGNNMVGGGVQHALLKLIEGEEVNVPLRLGNRNLQQEFVRLNTKNILFICGGAFEGLETDVIKEKSLIGFGREFAKDIVKIDKSIQDMLIQYGLIPEFVGRFSTVVQLQALELKDMVSILKDGKNALIKEYQRILEVDGVELVFEDAALEQIATLALERKIGARGLRSILEEVMQEILFQVPSVEDQIEKVIVNEETVFDHKMRFIDIKKEKRIFEL